MHTTGKVVNGLSSHPLALALVVINVLYLFGGGWLATRVMQRAEAHDVALLALARDCTKSKDN